MKKIALATSSLFVLVLGASRADAQAMNYGQLEQLFGEAVTTSATGSPQRVTEVPADMEIITAEQIRRSGATTIPDVLRHVSGIDVRQYGNADTQISVRGYAQPQSPRLLVLINGRQVYLDSYGYTAWATLPVQLSEIRQIEVVKGPNTALFGFNAVGGVINIITFDPLNDDVKTATASAGTQAELRASGVETFHPTDDFGIRLSGGAYRANEFGDVNQPLLNGFLPDDRAQNVSADSRYQVAPNTLLTAEATWSQSRNLESIATGAPVDSNYGIYSFKFGVTSDTSLGLLSLDAYRNHADWQFVGPTTPFIQFGNTVYVVQASDLFKIGTDNIFRVGVEYRHNDGSSGFLFSGHVGEQVYAASTMWSWQISPSLSLTNAARVDYLTLYQNNALEPNATYTAAQYNAATHTEPSFNSGLVYKASEDDTVRLLASRGIQAPSLVDFGGQYLSHSGPYNVNYLGNPEMSASAIMNYEIDYDRKLDNLASVLRLAVYDQHTSDIFNMQFDQPLNFVPPNNLDAQSGNIGSSGAVGGELELKGASQSGLRWDASYSFVSITDRLAVNQTTLDSPMDFAHGTPTSIIIAGGGYSWDRFDVDATARWQSRYTDIHNVGGSLTAVNIDSFLSVDARVGYKVTDNLTLAVSADQLNQQRITETGSVPTERRLYVTATVKM